MLLEKNVTRLMPTNESKLLGFIGRSLRSILQIPYRGVLGVR